MKNLLYFLKNSKKKYIAVYPDKYTEDNLKNYAYECGFDIESGYEGKDIPFNFHITVFFTESRHHNIANGEFFIDPFSVRATQFDLLGEERNIPVLKVESKSLSKIRERYENMGLRDKWGSYLPHISMSYNYSGNPAIEMLDLPDFPLIFDRIKIEDLNEGT